MKKLFIFGFVFCFCGGLFAQDSTKEAIDSALQKGNSVEIASHFLPSVDLTVENSENVYSKDQAEMILKKFFEDHKPKSFTLKHEGKSKIDDFYYIGSLVTENGNYRLTYFLKKSGDNFMIKQMRIEDSP